MYKLKVGFIFQSNNDRLLPEKGPWHHLRNKYFFIDGLSENDRIEYTKCCVEGPEVDCSQFTNFDILILFPYGRSSLIMNNLHKLKIPKVLRICDAHAVSKDRCESYREQNIKYFISNTCVKYTRKYLPEEFNFYNIIFGMKPISVDLVKFNRRKKDKILLTGKIKDKRCYVLRRILSNVLGVEYLGHGGAGVRDKYNLTLSSYRASIAACTVQLVWKNFEIPACGTLCFMEVNEQNGYEEFSFVDRENAIFITKDNYQERFKEFLDNPDNPKWEQIALNGRDLIEREYSNEVQVSKFIDILYQIVEEK